MSRRAVCLLSAAAAACTVALFLVVATRVTAMSAPVAAACRPSWAAVASPAVDGGELRAIAASSATDAWAVGGASSSWWVTPRPAAFIEHWDGKQWTVATSPAVAGVLVDVAATSQDDAWAVGALDSNGGAFVEHWNGSAWTQMRLPGVLKLSAVGATASRDVWAVGVGAAKTAVVEHWNGSRWTQAASRPHVDLNDVVAISAHDVWAVGDKAGTRFLEMHWNGRSWFSYTQPPPSDGKYGRDYDPTLTATAATGSRDVWVGGDAGEAGDPDWADTAVFHWDGNAWHREAADRTSVWVDSLVTIRPGQLWLAGRGGDYLGYDPLFQLWRGAGWLTTRVANGQWTDGIAADRAAGL